MVERDLSKMEKLAILAGIIRLDSQVHDVILKDGKLSVRLRDYKDVIEVIVT